MKKIMKFFVPFLALLCMTTSCYDTMDDKSVVEAGWGSTNAPTVTLNNVDVTSFSTADLKVTFDNQTLSEVGAVVSTSEDLSDPTYQIGQIADGTTDAVIQIKKLAPNTTYYVAAYAINKYGTRTISEAKKITTPDVPLTVDMICGHFASAVYPDYWGDPSQITDLIVEVDPDVENGVLVMNLDPYFASNGFTSDKGYNIFKGEVNLDQKTITVPAGQKIGYQDVVIMGLDAPTMAEAEDYDDLHISIKDYGETLVIENAWGTNAGGWWSLQNGPIVLSKK